MGLLDQLIGQTLDDKYRIDRQLGQGGMGAVYLATHMGTGRPVALKVINPRYMKNEEFVARFKREARAAGLLRHPNIVNVTDFGFASALDERVAYLVMEYLDGCSLSEVLEEEKLLPLEWVVDVVEQICLAIGKAHQFGIIHRDLKPDNIWLEPNERGGQTVKVLDFGLARLSDSAKPNSSQASLNPIAKSSDAETVKVAHNEPTPPRSEQQTEVIRSSTTESIGKEEVTRIAFSPRRDEQATEIIRSKTTGGSEGGGVDTVLSGGLTEVGSVLGTPLYMSPEQCMGEPLDSSSDIYSLGVITYEMLGGETPFTGDTNGLIVQHIQMPPPPLKEKRPDIKDSVEELIMSALAKKTVERPATAEAFANAFRARVEDAGTILRKALALYSEHFPLFFRLAFIAYIPTIAVIFLWALGEVAERAIPSSKLSLEIVLTTLDNVTEMFAWVFSAAVFVPIVAQLVVAPLRPVQIRAAIMLLKKRLRPFVAATLWVYVLILFLYLYLEAIQGLCGGILGEMSLLNKAVKPMLTAKAGSLVRSLFELDVAIVVLFAAPAYYAIKTLVNYMLYPSVIIMKGLPSRKALARSKELVGRVRRTVIKLVAIFLVIEVFEEALALLVDGYFIEWRGPLISSIAYGTIARAAIAFIDILLNPVITVSLALLFFKARQTSGETIREVLGDYQREEVPTSQWQARMLERLSVRISRDSKP